MAAPVPLFIHACPIALTGRECEYPTGGPSVAELAFVLQTVRSDKDPDTVGPTVCELSFVAAAVGPSHESGAVWSVIPPGAFVVGSVGPFHGANTFTNPCLPLADVARTVGPDIRAGPVPNAFTPLTSIDGAVGPLHGSAAMGSSILYISPIDPVGTADYHASARWSGFALLGLSLITPGWSIGRLGGFRFRRFPVRTVPCTLGRLFSGIFRCLCALGVFGLRYITARVPGIFFIREVVVFIFEVEAELPGLRLRGANAVKDLGAVVRSKADHVWPALHHEGQRFSRLNVTAWTPVDEHLAGLGGSHDKLRLLRFARLLRLLRLVRPVGRRGLLERWGDRLHGGLRALGGLFAVVSGGGGAIGGFAGGGISLTVTVVTVTVDAVAVRRRLRCRRRRGLVCVVRFGNLTRLGGAVRLLRGCRSGRAAHEQGERGKQHGACHDHRVSSDVVCLGYFRVLIAGKRVRYMAVHASSSVLALAQSVTGRLPLWYHSKQNSDVSISF